MTDRSAARRRKARFIVEVRYSVVPQFLDHRGRIIASIHPELLPRFKDWDARPDSILFTDDRGHPTAEVYIGSKRTSVIMEDPDSLQLFLDTAHKVLHLMHTQLGSWIPTATRVGVRFVTIASSPFTSYEETLSEVMDRFHKTPTSLPFRYKDSQAVVVHEYGRFAIGPTKVGDEWLRTIFKNSERNVPDVGVALDVDSYAQNVPIRNGADLKNAVHSVVSLTIAVEEDLLNALHETHVEA